jgi:hypothetical protein
MSALTAMFPPIQTPDSTEAVHLAAKAFLDARAAKQQADDAAKRANELLDQAESALLAILQANKIPLWVEDGFKLSASKKEFYSVLVDTVREDKGFRRWMKRMKGWDLVRETVHPQSFAKWCRELVEAGKRLNPAIRKAEQQVISVRKD